MRHLVLAAAMFVAFFTFGTFTATAETTECTEITVLPATINTQGVYCLKKNLVTAIASGNAITINTNNVTIDLNGWKLGGAAAGAGTLANGIFALDRINIVLRNGSIRGFLRGIFLDKATGPSSGHIVEGILADGNRQVGIFVEGDGTTIRNNKVTNTGLGTNSTVAYGISAGFGEGISIIRNMVSVVEETASSAGIYVDTVKGAEVRNNRVFDIIGNVSVSGIVTFSSERVVFKDNTVIVTQPGGGTRGIGDIGSSFNVGCIDNQVSGVGFPFDDCDTSSGNVAF